MSPSNSPCTPAEWRAGKCGDQAADTLEPNGPQDKDRHEVLVDRQAQSYRWKDFDDE